VRDCKRIILVFVLGPGGVGLESPHRSGGISENKSASAMDTTMDAVEGPRPHEDDAARVKAGLKIPIVRGTTPFPWVNEVHTVITLFTTFKFC
jgi:hypothetical protein